MRGRPPQIQNDAILDAARDVFLEEGHGATTAKIAQRAGVSEGILFYRFKSRSALLAAVIERETLPPVELRDLARTAADSSFEENLEKLVTLTLRSVQKASPFIGIAESSPRSDEVLKLLKNNPNPPPKIVVELIAGYLVEEMRLGRIRKIDPFVVGRVILGSCMDFVRAQHLLPLRGDEKAFTHGLIDLLLHGVAKPPSRQR